MAKGLGNNYWLWIESTTPGTYNYVKGQGDLSVARSAGDIDLSSKADAPYGSSAPGLRSLTISFDVKPDLPDATGYTRLETLCNAAVQVPFNAQIRKDGSAGDNSGDVVFAGAVYGSITRTNFGQNAALEVGIQLTNSGAPTTDVLAV